MKLGMRTPSIKKSIKARTTGKGQASCWESFNSRGRKERCRQSWKQQYILYMYGNCWMKCLHETDVFYKIGSWRRDLCNERENIYQQNIGFDITCVWYTLVIFICALLLQRKSCAVYLYWCYIFGTFILVYWNRDFYYHTKESKNISCAMDIRDY